VAAVSKALLHFLRKCESAAIPDHGFSDLLVVAGHFEIRQRTGLAPAPGITGVFEGKSNGKRSNTRTPP
jgi:hypothetical protein